MKFCTIRDKHSQKMYDSDSTKFHTQTRLFSYIFKCLYFLIAIFLVQILWHHWRILMKRWCGENRFYRKGHRMSQLYSIFSTCLYFFFFYLFMFGGRKPTYTCLSLGWQDGALWEDGPRGQLSQSGLSKRKEIAHPRRVLSGLWG